MYPKLIITMGVLLILLLPRDSNASRIRTFFKFAQDDSLDNRSIQVAPSPSPVSSVDSNFGGGSGGNGDQVPPSPSPSPSPLAEPNDGITDERCEISSSRWCQDLKNMTACLPGSEYFSLLGAWYLRMGDHFVLLVDRLLTESTLEAAIESLNLSKQTTTLGTDDIKIDISSRDIHPIDCSIPRKIVECRICQDEDEDSNMETPCSCCGSLKYAHRRCIQRWCNEKGDTVCEICHQPFKPGYTAPPPMFQLGSIPMNFRGNWEISRRDLNNPRFVAMVTTEPNFVDPDYDEYAASESRSLFCCRSVAAIFMVLLILRHTLPILVNGARDYSFPLFLLLLLRTTGIIVPIYIMVKTVNAIKRCQSQRGALERGSSIITVNTFT